MTPGFCRRAGGGLFANRRLAAHLLRGAIAAALLAWAVVNEAAHPAQALAAGVAAVVAMRGCPMCWIVGLLERVLSFRSTSANHVTPTLQASATCTPEGDKNMALKKIMAVPLAAIVCTLLNGSAVDAATIRSVVVFARGADVKATGPDSITAVDDSIWVSYTNGADSTGLSGGSTIVQYDLRGKALRTFSIAGSVDGLKVNPGNGSVWALQNQDGNSTLTVIDPDEGITPESPIPYAVLSSTRGYDDVVFRGNRIFLSYTNPNVAGDATIQMLVKGSEPLAVKTILTMGATGTNLATGQRNQPTTQTDPDSLKLTPFGDLQLSSGADGQLIFVRHPGTDDQAVSFLTLLDPTTHLPVSGLDDALFATARRGVFYLADTSNNRIIAITVDDLDSGSLFASVGSLNALVSVDLRTGVVTPFLGNLKGPHGLAFQPRREDDR
jgi:hypothetical protein